MTPQVTAPSHREPGAAPLRRHARPAAPPRPTRRVQRRRRMAVGLAMGLVFGVMFAAAALQVVLIGNQRDLDRLNVRISDARERQYSLRRQETLLRSPQDVADIAQTKLGMVPPERAVLVAPTPLTIGVTTTAPAPAPIPAPAQ